MGPSPEKTAALDKRIESLGLLKSDFDESFMRSSGKGGQHVNKTSSCVRIRHLPTGLEVKCQDTRSLFLNRFLALRRLVDKIKEAKIGAQSEARQKIEKIRRQKRKRSKRAKEKVLMDKKNNSIKKADRKFNCDLLI
jgi:protein subunit release factor B